jgi:hypothetical protein
MGKTHKRSKPTISAHMKTIHGKEKRTETTIKKTQMKGEESRS